MVSWDNRIMCGGEEVTLPELKAKVKEFIENPTNSDNLPMKKELDIPLLGTHMTTAESHLISLQCDRSTSYQLYIDVQNELSAAYNELRNELSQRYFLSNYNILDKERMEAIQKYYPQKISEAEPKNYGEKK